MNNYENFEDNYLDFAFNRIILNLSLAIIGGFPNKIGGVRIIYKNNEEENNDKL